MPAPETKKEDSGATGIYLNPGNRAVPVKATKAASGGENLYDLSVQDERGKWNVTVTDAAVAVTVSEDGKVSKEPKEGFYTPNA